MMEAVKNHIIPALLAAIMFIVTLPFIESIMRYYNSYSPAIEWKSARAVTPMARPGGVLEIEYVMRVNRQCPSDLRGFLVAPDGTVPVRMPTTTGGYTRPSYEWRKVPVKILIPEKSDNGLAPLESGEYRYRTVATRYCPEGVEQDAHITDVYFTLEVK